VLRKVLTVLVFLSVAGTASATSTTSTFEASGTKSGNPIHAQADFTFNRLTLQLTLKLPNLLPSPTTAAQNITDFEPRDTLRSPRSA
jgi:hypothetical protein